MKLIPKSIMARTIWVLTIGFFLIILDTVLISVLLFKTDSEQHNVYATAIEIKTLVNLLAHTPNEDKQQLIQYYRNPNLTTQWYDKQKPTILPDNHWGTEGFQKHLLQQLSDVHIKQVFVRHFHDEPETFHFVVTIQLDDLSWLEFKGQAPSHHTQWAISSLTVLGVFFIGIYILALLISRQVIRPVKQFANAAMQFSTDINAPAMEPCGPSEIQQAIAAFNLMQERIRLFVSERLEISAAISHDLRTPLTRLRLRAEAITDPEQQRKALQDISDMQSMLEATLAFARDDTDSEEKSQVDLAVLTQSVCDNFNDSGAQVTYSGPNKLTYFCKALAIKRALNNLIDNAVKYGGSAAVSVASTETQITIRIVDPGPGIEQEQQEKVFSPFYRIEKSRNRETGGTGLGLTLARTIVRSHGGDIRFDFTNDDKFIVIINLPKESHSII